MRITREMIKRGVEQNLIKFVVDPNMESGTVCQIGIGWFYIAGLEAVETPPELYLEKVGVGEAVEKVHEILEEFRKGENETEYMYYYYFLEENLSKWAEIKCDYLDETDFFWRVDAWRTCDDNEEGKVVAFVDDITGRVIYADPEARIDRRVQAVVNEKVEEIRNKKITVRLTADGIPNVRYQTPLGVITADPDPITTSMYIGLEASTEPYVEAELLEARVKETNDGKIMCLYTWDNIRDEKWNHRYAISESEIAALVQEEKDEN